MATFDAVAEPLSTDATALSPRTGGRRTAAGARALAGEHAGHDGAGQREKEALRRRLFEMILRNEQLRRVRPR
jgi:hypothetical protein